MKVSLGETRVQLSEHFGDATPGAGVRMMWEDVEAFCAALNAKGYRYSRPKAGHMPWRGGGSVGQGRLDRGQFLLGIGIGLVGG